MSMIHEITASVPRNKKGLRKGRGESSGHGKTSGRGTKGTGSRGGKPNKHAHEGGQTPLFRRLPTRGFSNDRWARPIYSVNIGDICATITDASVVVDIAVLAKVGLVPDTKLDVKILGDGEVTRAITVKAKGYSKSASEKILAKGGTTLNAKGEPFKFVKPAPRFAKGISQKAKPTKAAAAPAAPAKAPETPQ